MFDFYKKKFFFGLMGVRIIRQILVLLFLYEKGVMWKYIVFFDQIIYFMRGNTKSFEKKFYKKREGESFGREKKRNRKENCRLAL